MRALIGVVLSFGIDEGVVKSPDIGCFLFALKSSVILTKIAIGIVDVLRLLAVSGAILLSV